MNIKEHLFSEIQELSKSFVNDLEMLIKDPSVLALILKDKIYFDKISFNEIYYFFKKQAYHFYVTEGIRNYLMPRITNPDEYKKVNLMLPDATVDNMVLKKNRDRFEKKFQKDPSSATVFIQTLIQQILSPNSTTSKEVRKGMPLFPYGFQTITNHITDLSSTDEGVSKALMSCHNERLVETARESWFYCEIFSKTKSEENDSFEKAWGGWEHIAIKNNLSEKFLSTDNLNIKFLVALSLKNMHLLSVYEKLLIRVK